jgi:hypothetical protein
MPAMKTMIPAFLPKSRIRTLVATAVGLGVLLSGCTTLRNVPLPVSPGDPVAVRIGDQVTAQRRDGTVLAFQVTNVGPDALKGRGVTVRYADLTTLRAKHVSAWRTGGLVAGSVVGVVLVVGALGGFAVTLP